MEVSLPAPLFTEIFPLLPLDYEDDKQQWGLLELKASETGTGERWAGVGYRHVKSGNWITIAQDPKSAEAAAILWVGLKSRTDSQGG